MSKINVFACGGAGTNIAVRIAGLHGETHPGFAQLDSYFIDTSRSNLSASIPDERVYLFKDTLGNPLDGNGKLRTNNYDIISHNATIQDILHKFPPADLNVVLNSGGGGTGSVAGPLLAKELIARGEMCIVILVGSTMSKMDVKNTLNTIKTYESLASKLSSPLNVVYRENTTLFPRSAVDSEIEQFIYLLSAVFSGQNHGLDSADLRNFLNYNNVTDYKPRLTALDLFSETIKLPDDCVAITAVTLTKESVDVDHGVLVDYQVTGIGNPKMISTVKVDMPLHAVVFSGFFPPQVARLQALLRDHDDKAKRVSNRAIISNTDETTDDGVIL